MFGKIFEQIYNSTVCQDWQVLIVFQQCIILSDDLGILDMTPEAMSRRTGIPVDIILRGIEELEKPDPRSRSTKSEGRRLERIDSHRDWGWIVVNKPEYRRLASRLEKQQKDAERIAAKRAAEKTNDNADVATSRNLSHNVANVAHTDTDTDTIKPSGHVPKTEHATVEDPPGKSPPVQASDDPDFCPAIGGRPPPPPPNKKKQAGRKFSDYVQLYLEMYRGRFGRDYIVTNVKDDTGSLSFVYAQVDRDREKLGKLIAKYFESDSKPIVESGWNIRMFRYNYNAIAAKVFGDTKAAEPWRI